MSNDEQVTIEGPVCPLPLTHGNQIVMGHGSGGRMSHELITGLFLPPLDNPILRAGDDGGVIEVNKNRFSISTDSHVVWPLFFPGGDIGRLAVCGTVNDVAMMGARPLYLTAGFILEEGLDIETLEKVIASMRSAAEEAGVLIIAGDTKVVQKGKADSLYINTTGIGLIQNGIDIGGARAIPGDVVILSGSIGDHGIAVLGARGDLGFETDIQSDVAPLNHLIAAILQTSNRIHVMRDPTRGGLATSLNEIARQSQVGIVIQEESILIKPAVNSVCELLGFDPLYVANEGKLIVVLAREDAQQVLMTMRNQHYGADSVIIGEICSEPQGRVLMKTSIGSTRVVDMLTGEMLPRIC